MAILLNETIERIKDHSESPGLDAQVLLAYITVRPRAWVLAHPEMTLDPAQRSKYEQAISRLSQGIPLPYILGSWDFFGLNLMITPDVLIPRPETELLVETALNWLRLDPGRRRVIDTGTGSGCIAIALAVNIPDLLVLATDISPPALQVARQNARKFKLTDRVEFTCCDLFPQSAGLLSGRVDLMVSNLPYIPSPVLKGLKVYGREPGLALDGGEDGLDIIRKYLTLAPAFIKPDGLILLEMEASQGRSARSLACDHFPRAEISVHPDLAGKDRLLEIKLGS
jgi:release factor glutamine methyltransferase